MNEFKEELKQAISKYGKDHIDIIFHFSELEMFGSYHSKNNSFPVTENYSIDVDEAMKIAKELDIAHSDIG